MSFLKSKGVMAVAGGLVAAATGYVLWNYYNRKSTTAKKSPFTHKQLHRFHRIWKKLDKNSDGQLDEHEVRHLAKLLYTPSPAEIAAAVARFDANHDSKISFDEFVTRLSTVDAGADSKQRASKIELTEHDLADLKAQFDELDTNRDGSITGDEAVALARDAYVPPQHTVDSIMAALDIDKNKSVSLDEFLQYMARAVSSVSAEYHSVQAMVQDYEKKTSAKKN